MQDKQILKVIKDAYSEFFEYIDKKNALGHHNNEAPIEPSFEEFMV